MAVNLLLERDGIIESLQHAVSGGEHGLKIVPPLIKRVIAEDCWRERYVRLTGERVEFGRFVDFVSREPPEGLGADLPLIKRMCADDPEAIDLIDRASVGRQGQRNDIHNNVQEVIVAPTGNAADAAMRRLRKDRPDLHNEVIRGRKSPHAAMVEAGFRPKTATVRLDDPDKVSVFLAKHFDTADIRKIADLAVHIREGQA